MKLVAPLVYTDDLNKKPVHGINLLIGDQNLVNIILSEPDLFKKIDNVRAVLFDDADLLPEIRIVFE